MNDQEKIELEENKKKKPKLKKNGKPRKRWGDRRDGRRVRSLPPMMYVVPFVMKDRCDAQNYFKSRVDMDIIDAYLRHKRGDRVYAHNGGGVCAADLAEAGA